MAKIRNIAIIVLSVLLLFGIIIGVAGCNAGTQNELQSKIDGLQSQLEEMNDRLVEIEEQIVQMKKELQDLRNEMQNYVLKISADKQVYRIEEDILIDIVLENCSGTDIDIAYYSPLAIPESSTGQFPAIEQSPEMTKKIFKNGESIRMTDRLEGCFSAGQHELKYRAVFYIGVETTQSVVVNSNSIEFSVIE